SRGRREQDSLGSFRQNARLSSLVPSPLAGEGTMVCPRPRMGEGLSRHTNPSPIIARGSTELPSPARGEGTTTATALVALFTFQTAHPRSLNLRRATDRHRLGKGGPSRSRGAFPRPGFASLLSSPRMRVGGTPRDVRVLGGTHLGRALGASQDARERAYDAARQAPSERRLASHNAGRSPLGAPPWRFWAPGPRFSHRHLRRGGYSELLAPRS